MDAPLSGELPGAPLAEQLAFNALVLVPNALQGLFAPRAALVRAATDVDVSRASIALLGRLRDRAGGRPIRLRALRDRAVLVFGAADLERVLDGSPAPFAPDPPAKRRGMSHFQPDALTLSRGALWEDRRRFTEAVLDTREPRHRLADRFSTVADEETQALLDAAGDELRWETWHAGVRRTARRVILGDGARHDEHVSRLLTTLMEQANRLPAPGEPSELLEQLMARLASYVSAAEQGSLVGLFAGAPCSERTDPAGQVPHWLFAMGDTLAMNSFRALALLASHPEQRAMAETEIAVDDGLRYVEACLEEAMRLWPTTALLGRETIADSELAGATIPAGTQVLISNTFNHRDRETHAFADRFAPEEWTTGDARDDWTLNHFSRGRQCCPGAGLARVLGAQVLATALSQPELRLIAPRLDPARPLPAMLDFFRLRFALR